MSQWRELLKLDSALQGRVSQLYEGKFPREIRHYLCVLIEGHDWDLAASDENEASACFLTLIVFLEEQWNRTVQENNILQGPDLQGMKDYLLNHFQHEPMNLAEILSECLKEERNILASASETQCVGSPTMEQKGRELDVKVKELKRQISELKKELMSLEELNEKLECITVVESEFNFNTQTEQMVVQQIVNILKMAEQIVATLTDVELPEWKLRQQMACIGSPVDTCLEHLQEWFTTVAGVLLQVNNELQKLQDQKKKSNLTGPMAEIEKFSWSLLTKLLANALVIEKQPVMTSLPQRPLILKTGVRFTVTVRFLANLPAFQGRIKVKPVFDKDVEEANTVTGFRQFNLDKTDSKVLDVNTPDEGLVAEFDQMSPKVKKGRPKGYEYNLKVTEELHIIKFVTEFQYAGLECNIEASSLPLVVICSTNQVPSAWASVMWSNLLSTCEPRKLLFFVDPPPLTWQQLSQALSWQFLSVGQRGLDENQLSMLRDKFVDDPDGLIHWSNFSKNESAWIWIDGILDLIKKHLVDLWRDGSIMGFVSRERTWALLQEKETGTFLLRFSESNKDGAITISWVENSNGETHVHAVEPYTKQNLSAISLPDSITHYRIGIQGNTTWNPLLYLYPDIPKDTAFGRYYNTSETLSSKKPTNGYVRLTLIPFSDAPTLPPSPPGEMEMMEI